MSFPDPHQHQPSQSKPPLEGGPAYTRLGQWQQGSPGMVAAPWGPGDNAGHALASRVQPRSDYGWWVLGTYAYMVVLGAWSAPEFYLVSAPVIVTAGIFMVGGSGGRTGPVIGVVGGGLVAMLFLTNLISTLADGGNFGFTAWGETAGAAGVLSASISCLLDMNKRANSSMPSDDPGQGPYGH